MLHSLKEAAAIALFPFVILMIVVATYAACIWLLAMLCLEALGLRRSGDRLTA